MVHKLIRNQPPPENDEAWWTALLAEEKKQAQPNVNHHVSSSTIADREKGIERHLAKNLTIDWEYAHSLYAQDETVHLPVNGYNRGGVLVGQVGLQGFVPVSHLLEINCQTDDEDRNQILASYVGRQINLKVIECDAERGRVIFSERAALAGAGRRNQVLDNILPGERTCGFVTNITDFGVFVDLGGVEGLIHVSELSWGRVRHPEDVVQVGDKVNAIVLQVEKERARIALSIKRMHQNPWDTADRRYIPGQVVEVLITNIVPFGAFARVEEGLDGLIHATEFTGSEKTDENKPYLVEGQRVKVRVINVDPTRQRLGLSLRLE
jgi:small subunit ribosomal protein S1